MRERRGLAPRWLLVARTWLSPRRPRPGRPGSSSGSAGVEHLVAPVAARSLRHDAVGLDVLVRGHLRASQAGPTPTLLRTSGWGPHLPVGLHGWSLPYSRALPYTVDGQMTLGDPRGRGACASRASVRGASSHRVPGGGLAWSLWSSQSAGRAGVLLSLHSLRHLQYGIPLRGMEHPTPRREGWIALPCMLLRPVPVPPDGPVSHPARTAPRPCTDSHGRPDSALHGLATGSPEPSPAGRAFGWGEGARWARQASM